MSIRMRIAAVALLSVVPLIVPVGVASAHGSTMYPPSRTYQCGILEDPEEPATAACKAAIKAGGTQAFYDWDEVNLLNAGGRSRTLIPDGQLCGAGRSKFTGLNLARGDWPATRLTSGAQFTFQIRETADHDGIWTQYVTRNGYNPLTPLRWSDLEQFNEVRNPPLVGDIYRITTRLPAGRTGRHLIYTIWQRQLPDSTEAFYLCNDVIF